LRARVITQEHQRIVDAILARDPEAARRATYAHIENAFQRVSQGTKG
jgi:DNA-binding FadR family transcriptional regulator